jgi:3-methyladenine DNA glycosylase Tag
MNKGTKERNVELIEKSKQVVREAFEKFDPAKCAITWTVSMKVMPFQK